MDQEQREAEEKVEARKRQFEMVRQELRTSILYTPDIGPNKGQLWVAIVLKRQARDVIRGLPQDGSIPEGFMRVSRNRLCFCGSGKVFKRCQCCKDYEQKNAERKRRMAEAVEKVAHDIVHKRIHGQNEQVEGR